MADTMQFDLVSPERSLASLQVTEVQIPGADGDMTAMPNHAPMITTLRPGILRINGPEGDNAYVVTGGFAQISADGTSVLAEMAILLADATTADIDPMIEAAAASASNAVDGVSDVADKQLADLQALRDEIAA